MGYVECRALHAAVEMRKSIHSQVMSSFNVLYKIIVVG